MSRTHLAVLILVVGVGGFVFLISDAHDAHVGRTVVPAGGVIGLVIGLGSVAISSFRQRSRSERPTPKGLSSAAFVAAAGGGILLSTTRGEVTYLVVAAGLVVFLVYVVKALVSPTPGLRDRK
jgi:peptidoglycan/LPS O-acetylase OafA/YrhL